MAIIKQYQEPYIAQTNGDWMITPAVSCQSIVKVPLECSVQCTADMAGMAGHLNPFCPLITVRCVCQGFQ